MNKASSYETAKKEWSNRVVYEAAKVLLTAVIISDIQAAASPKGRATISSPLSAAVDR